MKLQKITARPTAWTIVPRIVCQLADAIARGEEVKTTNRNALLWAIVISKAKKIN